jgi:hypothetical protein
MVKKVACWEREKSRAVVRATNVGKSKHQPMTALDEPFTI